MNNNIRIVLINTSHPGNIGATARAMKTMGLKNLYLVNPKEFPNVNATAMASKADDILENAVVTDSLEEALKDVQIVFGTSARSRELPLKLLDPRETAKKISENNQSKIAILFGRENNGLTNEELELCNYHIHIPTDPNFSSLNLAAAVQLICYELNCQIRQNNGVRTSSNGSDPIVLSESGTLAELATTQEITDFYNHLEKTLLETKFLFPENKDGVMSKIKRMFNKAQLEKTETSILRGILTSINKISDKK